MMNLWLSNPNRRIAIYSLLIVITAIAASHIYQNLNDADQMSTAISSSPLPTEENHVVKESIDGSTAPQSDSENNANGPQVSTNADETELVPELFDLISQPKFEADLALLTSKSPKNDGRYEMLDENGLVILSDIRSPQENIELGHEEANLYRNAKMSEEELLQLSSEGDFAATIALARKAYRATNFEQGDAYIFKAARQSGLPAPLSIAGSIYRSQSTDLTSRALAGAWHLAAYISGDYSTALKVKKVFNTLPTEYHEFIIEHAQEILDEIGG